MKGSLVSLIMLMSLMGCSVFPNFRPPTLQEQKTQAFSSCPANYRELTVDHFRGQLTDPGSGLFRFARIEQVVWSGKYGEAFEVGVNAKNRFGGYAGEKIFTYFCSDNGIEEITIERFRRMLANEGGW